jgi:hypothetical protein
MRPSTPSSRRSSAQAEALCAHAAARAAAARVVRGGGCGAASADEADKSATRRRPPRRLLLPAGESGGLLAADSAQSVQAPPPRAVRRLASIAFASLVWRRKRRPLPSWARERVTRARGVLPSCVRVALAASAHAHQRRGVVWLPVDACACAKRGV